MPEDVAEPAGAKKLLLAQLPVLMMQGRTAGVLVGDARLPLLMQARQGTRLIVAVIGSCCQSRTNRQFEMRAPAGEVGGGRILV
jgi:mRNA-degrading endonuclease toxin of MazEF toxin-antitoxin module